MEIEIKHSPSTSILGATWIFQDSKFASAIYRLFASATKNSYKIGQKRVTLSPDKKKEEVIWERSDLIKSRSWLY